MRPNISLRHARQHASTRPRYRAARAFYLTLFIGACLATYAILHRSYLPPGNLPDRALYKRNNAPGALNEDEQCRLVHHAKDQCDFIKRQCPNEEAGFSAYLDLYYCKLPHLKAVAFIILISWLALLFSTIGIAASDFFCINLSTIATILGMSESMAGVTFLAFGNGSPDVFSTFAAMSTNSGSLAVGELFGAAGFITAVVAGSMALIRPFHVAKKSFVRDVGFFIVAAGFSMVFLWDGKLRFWECITMVLFYVFYVAFVVVWHWWIGRRRRRREKEAAARGHFIGPADELEIEQEEYHDDPDEHGSRRPSVHRGVSREDWSALERGGDAHPNEQDEDEEEEERDRWMSELNSNMRLTRPTRSRANTLTPVRPSLVGALEFQAVLKSLHKSRNIQTYPLNARRYSDDPTYTTAQQQDLMSTASDPASRPPYQIMVHDDDGTPTMERAASVAPASAPVRGRAVSANGAEGLQIDSDLQRLANRSSSQRNLIDLDGRGERPHRQNSEHLTIPGQGSLPQSPTIEISPSTPHRESYLGNVLDAQQQSSPNLLAPPRRNSQPRQTSQALDFGPESVRHTDGPQDSPRTVPRLTQLPKIIIPRRERSYSSTPSASPFPRYRDDLSPASSRPPSLYLPPASIGSAESLPISQSAEEEVPRRPTILAKWWPFAVLPPPGMLISTLFPTIYHWHEKNWWEKMLGIVAAPSVFLLTITLPVVESEKDGDESGSLPDKIGSLDSTRSKGGSANGIGSVNLRESSYTDEPRRASLLTAGATGHGTSATVATSMEQQNRHNAGEGAANHSMYAPDVTKSPQALPRNNDNDQQDPPELWNRWLLIIQLFLAPIFIVLAIYSQSPTDMDRTWLIKPILICLLVSLVILIPLLLTTTPTSKPAIYRYILSLAGFVVSIAWISTIASQVVGALKALAVILNMSHAIMGLTIFAVGNSLGDLVADVTVARLGYPVMALSACFGGPMLNILLGIGLSGSYILVRGAQKRVHKHPEKDFKFKSYHIDVGNTLLVSGATLLVTLIGLLIFIPMNRWVMSKRIGWALIVLWTLSTIGNVVLEVTGYTDRWNA